MCDFEIWRSRRFLVPQCEWPDQRPLVGPDSLIVQLPNRLEFVNRLTILIQDQSTQRFLTDCLRNGTNRTIGKQNLDHVGRQFTEGLDRILRVKVESSRLGPNVGGAGSRFDDEDCIRHPVGERCKVRRGIFGERCAGSP